MAADERDLIRLRAPADQAFGSVIDVATATLARSAGLAEPQVTAAEISAGAAFAELAGAPGAGAVELQFRLRTGHVHLHLAHGDLERSIEFA